MLEQTKHQPTADHRVNEIQELLLLASRLKQSHGGALDDDAILAVCEATGASPEYVRVALQAVPNRDHRLGINRLRTFFLSLDPSVRSYVSAGVFGCIAGMATAAAASWWDRFQLLGVVQIISGILAAWNCWRAQDYKTASISGSIYAGTWFVSQSIFMALFALVSTRTATSESAVFLIPMLVAGALGGGLIKRVANRILRKIGVTEKSERQELLQQLVELQDKLKASEKSLSFLCVDVVGSTKMKQVADPLAVEFTFGEYHNFVETIARKYGGRIHSTAGDGVTCAFENPQSAFAAARNLQAGLFELNTHRNRIGTPIRLRCGIHHGDVMTHEGDIQSINFSHVIDVASHLQRVCPEGGVAVSELAAAFIPGGPNAVGDERVEAQEVPAVIWRARTAVA